MIVDKNRIYDGWLSLEGGVDAGRTPNLIDANQVQSAINITFRSGSATTRPGFRKLTEKFPEITEQIFCYNTSYHDDTHDRIEGEYANPTKHHFPRHLTTNATRTRSIIHRNGSCNAPTLFRRIAGKIASWR
jgi:hypothetical protein